MCFLRESDDGGAENQDFVWYVADEEELIAAQLVVERVLGWHGLIMNILKSWQFNQDC